MRISKLLVTAMIITTLPLLAGCATNGSQPPIAPVTMSAGELQGTTVELVVGQLLNITTGDLAVDSYSGKVADAGLAEFVAGREDGSASFNPGVKALISGKTEVELSNSNGGIEPVTFIVRVSAQE